MTFIIIFMSVVGSHAHTSPYIMYTLCKLSEMNIITKVITLPNSCYTVLYWHSPSLLFTLDEGHDQKRHGSVANCFQY
jgi:hypothetical protein